jgi:hypothetical protein
MKLLDALPACEADELEVLILATRFRWGGARRSSASALRADSVIRGFAISSLIQLSVFSCDSLFEFLLAMIDGCTVIQS